MPVPSGVGGWYQRFPNCKCRQTAGHMHRGIAYGGAWATCSVLWPARDHKSTLGLWSWVWGWFKSKWKAPCEVIYSPTVEGLQELSEVISRQLGRQASSSYPKTLTVAFGYRQVWLKGWPSLKSRLQRKHRPVPTYLTRCLREGRGVYLLWESWMKGFYPVCCWWPDLLNIQ